MVFNLITEDDEAPLVDAKRAREAEELGDFEEF